MLIWRRVRRRTYVTMHTQSLLRLTLLPVCNKAHPSPSSASFRRIVPRPVVCRCAQGVVIQKFFAHESHSLAELPTPRLPFLYSAAGRFVKPQADGLPCRSPAFAGADLSRLVILLDRSHPEGGSFSPRERRSSCRQRRQQARKSYRSESTSYRFQGCRSARKPRE